jgi:hypothetical protein
MNSPKEKKNEWNDPKRVAVVTRIGIVEVDLIVIEIGTGDEMMTVTGIVIETETEIEEVLIYIVLI